MPGENNASRYRRYIAALNGGAVNDLTEFVHDAVLYNGQRMTRRAYQDMIADSIAAAPGLTFDVRLLVAEGDLVASRIWFDCLPTGRLLGLTPTGRRVAFAENVFYRFRDGRIEEVWSLIDRPAVEAQLNGEG